MNPCPAADESARILADHLRGQEPFSFWRFGDGFLECLAGKKSQTCDHEQYGPELAADLTDAWMTVVGGKGCYFGDWQAASFTGPNDPARYREQWNRLWAPHRACTKWLHPEALLFMRESQALADFWRAVREDPRRKLYFGVQSNWEAAVWLNADMLPTTMNGVHEQAKLYEIALEASKYDVLIFGAGLAGMIPAIRCWERHPDRTYIHIGSALDPLFRGKSRQQQLSRAKCWAMLTKGLPADEPRAATGDYGTVTGDDSAGKIQERR